MDLEPAARAAELDAWLHGRRRRLDRDATLVAAITREDAGRDELLGAVTVRDRPAVKLLSRRAHVYVDGLDVFMTAAEEGIRAHLRDSGLADGGELRVQFHDMVTRDNDGSVEVSVAYDGHAEPTGDLTVSLAPARSEVSLPVPPDYEDFPRILRVYDAV